MGSIEKYFKEIASLGKDYLKSLYRALEEATLSYVIRVAKLFPRLIEEEDNQMLMAPISRRELEDTLKSMQRDKSPGLDGWTVEFFQVLFYLIGDELLSFVEYSRTNGRIYKPFNSTFLALI